MQRNIKFEQYFLLTIFLGLFFWVLYPFLQGVLLGLLVAIVFFKPNHWLKQKLRCPAWVAATISTFLLSVFVVLPIFFIIYTLVIDTMNIVSSSGTYFAKLDPDLLSHNYIFEKVRGYLPNGDFSQVREKLIEFGSQGGAYVAGFLGRFLTSLPDFAFQVVMFVLALYYGLVDGMRFKAFAVSVLPFNKQDLGDLVNTTERIVSGVLWGSLIAGIAQGTIIGLGFLILGVPRAMFFALVTVIFSFVPMVGSIATGVGGAIYLAIQGNWVGCFIMLAIFGLASVSDNIVKPWALSGSASLHPLLGLASALGGLVVFGFLGLFLGPLLAALAIALLEIMQRREVAD